LRALVLIASTNPQFTADPFDKRPNNPHSQAFAGGWIKSFRQEVVSYAKTCGKRRNRRGCGHEKQKSDKFLAEPSGGRRCDRAFQPHD
jgi:hypothetical protein